VGGIGRVAVSPEARLSGIAYRLMERAVQIMDQNGMPLSILYPFRHSFYNKLGWGLAEQVRLYRFSPEDLPLSEERLAVVPVVTREDMEAVMACYHSFASERNGMLLRDEPVWYEQVSKNNLAYVYRSSASGEVEGYLFYRYLPHQSDRSFMTSDISIREMIWQSDRAFRGILGFLASQRDQVRAIEYHDHFAVPFEHILHEPASVDGRRNMALGAETAQVGSGLVGRIIQLRRVLAQSRFGRGSGRVVLQVRDSLHPANAESLTVEFDNGSAAYTRPNGSEATLKIDIATLSSIFWGKLSLVQAVHLGLAEIEGKSGADFLDKVLSFPRSVCLDYF
jgi:predicted acetyltransferase